MPYKRAKFAPQTRQDLWISSVGICLGIAVGMTFADIDLHMPDWLLPHRALFTHGAVVPVCLAWWFWHFRQQTVRGLTIGFALAHAVHLSFDLFPKAWRGYALIHVFTWALPPVLSWAWVAASIVCCLYLVRSFIRTTWDIWLSFGGILTGFLTYAHEGVVFPLIAFAIAGILASIIPLFPDSDYAHIRLLSE